MSISMEVVDFDKEFRMLANEPAIINTLSEATDEERIALNKRIFTTFDTDLMSNIPKCSCDTLTGQHNLGVVCTNCGTPVVYQMDQTIEPMLWMASPKEVSALINPHIWIMLNEFFKVGNFEILKYLTDTTYRSTGVREDVVDILQEAGVKRGYNSFCDNFDHIIKTLFESKRFKPKREKAEPLIAFLAANRNKIFCQYLPVPNKSILIVENTVVGKYVDFTIINAIEAIRLLVSIDTKGLAQHVKENRTAKAITALSKFYYDYYGKNLASKEGSFRHNVFGSLAHFSFRAVISSITQRHEYDEIYIPWGVGVTVFNLHLMNKLLKRNFTVNEAMGYLNAHANKHSTLLEEIFQELIDESPQKGIYCTAQRNPSLERGSAQRVKITRVKNDVQDPTVSISIITVKAYNADFDGKANLIAISKLF